MTSPDGASESSPMTDECTNFLASIGFRDDELHSLVQQAPNAPLVSSIMTVAELPAAAALVPDTYNVWLGINALRPGIDKGRGAADDVAALRVVAADIDLQTPTKASGCKDPETAWAIMIGLSEKVGQNPTAVVDSGHGFHAYWAVEDGDVIEDFTNTNAQELSKRFGDLVAVTAAEHDTVLDRISDLSRILRVPGSVNNKATPVPVRMVPLKHRGSPLSVTELRDRLDEWLPTVPEPTAHVLAVDTAEPVAGDARLEKIVSDRLAQLAACPNGGYMPGLNVGDKAGRQNALNLVGVDLGGFRGLNREMLRQRLIAACTTNRLVDDDGLRSVEATITSAFNFADTQPPKTLSEQAPPAFQVPDEWVPRDDGDGAENGEIDLLSGMFSGGWLQRQVFALLEYVVPGIIPEGATLCSAPPKVGKSWFALLLALMVALGGVFLGHRVQRRPVLYLALEDGHRRLQERARKLLGGEPIPELFNYMLVVNPLTAPAVVTEFLSRHPDEKPLVIVDTLGRIKPQRRSTDESYLSDYHFAANLKAAIDSRPGAALLAIHHTRKAESDDFVEAGSGTLGLAGAFDTVLVLRRKRHEQTGVLHVTGRDVEEGRYALRVDDGRWELDGSTLIDASEAAQERLLQSEVAQRFSERTRDVLAVVNQRGREDLITTAQDVAQQIDITTKRATEVLGRLVDADAISKVSKGVYAPALPVAGGSADHAGSAGIAGQGRYSDPHSTRTSMPSADRAAEGIRTRPALVSASAGQESSPDQYHPHDPHDPHNPIEGLRIEGPGRCRVCSYHVATQGHQQTCSEATS